MKLSPENNQSARGPSHLMEIQEEIVIENLKTPSERTPLTNS